MSVFDNFKGVEFFLQFWEYKKIQWITIIANAMFLHKGSLYFSNIFNLLLGSSYYWGFIYSKMIFSREYSILSKHPGMMWICAFILFFNGQTLVTSEQKLVWSFVFFFSSFNIFKCFHVSKQLLFSAILLSHSASIIFLVHSLHVVDEESEISWKSCKGFAKVQNYAK